MVRSVIIDVKALCISYGATQVLQDVSFSMGKGEILGLVGLNGVGKTTLIKGMLGLQKITTGEILVFDAAPADKKNKGRIAYLPERFEPPLSLNGYEFLNFIAKLYRCHRSEAEIAEAAKALALNDERLSKRIVTYSKGMRQKLGLLAAFLSGSEVLILDEPMSGLDPRARRQVKEALKVYKKQGVSIFFSSHMLGDVAEICDEVIVLDDGKIKFKGTPLALCKTIKEKKSAEGLEKAFLHVIENRKAA